tara:strand:- start:85 stop:912 length:828 start_codon:yes stop_codon:yes gene_type:complete
MAETPENTKAPLFTNPLETYPGLTIDHLNKYLPAIRTVEDITLTKENMVEGIFLAKCLEGLKQIPDDSIDLLIATPPDDPWAAIDGSREPMTLQEYYQWNNAWLIESHRVLKNTGAIYVFTPWEYSGMYQGLITNLFKVQSRITWRKKMLNPANKIQTWDNDTSDIWFATKTDDFLFNQTVVGLKSSEDNDLVDDVIRSNLWLDIPNLPEENGIIPQKVISRILNASSFKLNWVLDPFMGTGDVGVAAKMSGRRFIGFETNKDHLLLAMKRIDES